MRLLLDTHVVLWWSRGDRPIRPSWTEAILDPSNESIVSAVTAWEIEVKKRSGRLEFSSSIFEVAADNEFTTLDISVADASLAGSLDWDHKDPFDRMLVAQALERGLTLVTADESMRSAPGVRFLD
ncbi:MAG: type II toxin-antitoxin system VapC family toxin [Actinobacteria bacterium]|nr:type II toxin-antitoxin system VapC family toxin [Actinomycetota bacterium]